MQKNYVEIDIGEEFERLWESTQTGPDASALSSCVLKCSLGLPLAPRLLRAEDFRAWLLP